MSGILPPPLESIIRRLPSSETTMSFGPCKDRRQVIAGVTGFALRKIRVIEIEVSDESAIVESDRIRSGGAAANQRAFSCDSNSLICCRRI